MHDAIGAYLSYLAAAGTSRDTIRVRRHYLSRFARAHADVDWRQLGDDELVTWLARPAWAAETRKSARASLRGFYRWAYDHGHVESDPGSRLPAVTVPAGVPRPAPDEVVGAALERADNRGRVMVLLAAEAGLRRAEIAHSHTSWRFGSSLHVHGKGGKVRTVPLSRRLAAELSRLEAEQGDGYYFPGNVDGHLSPGHVGKLLARLLGSRPGAEWRGWSAHTLRHRFASRAYAGERDILAVQRLLGHSKPETTTRYTLVEDDSLRRAVDAAAG